MKIYRTGKTNTLGYFNLLKGCGILWVLAFHTVILYFERDLENQNLFTINGAGLMAMFFIISGFGFYKRKPMRCLNMQFKLIMAPYIWMCAFILIERVVYNFIRGIPFKDNGGSLILTYLFGLCVYPERTVLGYTVSFVGLLWFILALFTGWIIYNQISQIKENKMIRLCIMCSVFLGWLLPKITDLWPYCIPQGLLAAGCLYIGESIRKNRLLERKLSPVIYVGALIWIGISEIFGGGDMGTNYWRFGLFDVVSAYLIGLMFIRVYYNLYPYIPENKITEILEMVGGESFLVFCIHGVERVTVPWYVIQRYIANQYLGTCLYFLMRCVFIFIVYRVIKKIQRWLNQRKRRKKVTITLE